VINNIISKLRLFLNPDPIPIEYALKYIDDSYLGIQYDKNIIKIVGEYINPGNTKILDLGAGPGLYCKKFYDLGAQVTWHDVSLKYKISAFTLMKSNNQNWNFKLDIIDNIEGKYDIIFNRVCWYYCLDDKIFLKSIYNALNETGVFVGVLHNENRLQINGFKRFFFKIQFIFNEKFNIKIGHPPPSKEKINKIFSQYNFSSLKIEDYGLDTLIVFKK
tara:strand:- start:21 stop:674 length:654 start_codon:yes stop_codon:yes gene_type:complete